MKILLFRGTNDDHREREIENVNIERETIKKLLQTYGDQEY